MKKALYTILISIFISITLIAQEKKDISKMTKEDVLELTYDELLEMPFEDVLKLAEIVGVSLEELYEMLLNKDVVSASKKVESSFEAPLSTSVISYDEIIASGARTIEEALRLVPGLIVREKTNGNFDIHIRGNDNVPPKHMFIYSENSISLIMIDGRPVYNYVHGGTFWETLPIDMSDIDRIEVVRGPSSALYGPNAVSGVVNIITKTQSNKSLKVNANTQIGTQNSAVINLGIGGGIYDKLLFRVTGNLQTMDRNNDKLYVYEANDGDGGYVTKYELDTLRKFVTSPFDSGYFYIYDPSDGVDKMYPDPKHSRQRYGANAYLFYNISDEINFNLKGGYQYSDILSTTMGDNPVSLAGRESNTGYIDFNAKIYDLTTKVNYLNGWQDIVKQDTGFKVDIMNVNANLEYDFILGDLNLRPGFAYQLARYNDLPYLHTEGQGFLNAEREINSLALSLRADYLIAKKLRLIGAIRGGKYNTHDDLFISYQIIVSYDLNNVHHIRFVHSLANRGPFLVDSYANYGWLRNGRPSPGFIYFEGKENLDLLKMRMFELGYRVKPAKNIQADLELFYTQAYDYGALYPDSVNLVALPMDTRPYVNMQYRNIEVEAQQVGLTATLSWVAKENLIIKVFGTYQYSELKDIVPISPDKAIEWMITNALIDPSGFSTNFLNKRESKINKATPSFYGGLITNYSPLDKLNLNLNSYFYSGQEFDNKYVDLNGTQTIDPKFILNLNVSYELIKGLNLNINMRNLLGEKQEFAYTDKIGRIFLLGLSYKL